MIDLEVPAVPLTWAGARAWVHIEYRAAPLAAQLARRVKQVFVSRLGSADATPAGADPF